MMSKLALILSMALIAGQAHAAEQQAAVRVNDTVITEKEVVSEIDRLIPQSTYHARITPERQQEFRDKAIENLIDRELQYQEALRLKLVPDRKAVDGEMESTRSRFKTKKEYQEALKSAGFTEKELRRLFEKNNLVKLAVEAVVTRPSTVSDDAIREYYAANPSRSSVPESVRIRIISSKEKSRIAAAQERVKAGEDFGAVAAQLSEDNFRIKGGDIGYVHRGRLVPAIEEEAFSLKAGQVSKVIEAEQKWFLLKVEDRKEAHRKSYEEAREGLKKELEQQRAQEAMKAWMDGLRGKARIELVQSSPTATDRNPTKDQ